MSNQLLISMSPHIRDKGTVSRIMWDVNIALIPALIGSIYFFGLTAIYTIVSAIAGALLAEYLSTKIRGVPNTIKDGSALITGILLAFNLPPHTPLWMPFLGAAIGIIVGKQFFGGLGNNPLNPALIGRAFLLASWPVTMTKWYENMAPSGGTLSGLLKAGNLITSATPLTVMKTISKAKHALPAGGNLEQSLIDNYNALIDAPNLINLLVGRVGGCIGETSALLLIIGGIYLLAKKIIDWKIPATYFGTIFVLSILLGGIEGKFCIRTGLFHLFAGGVMLGGIFMLTDMVTSPVTPLGRIIYGIGGGLIVIIIRFWGGYPEGCCYSILIMNVTVPLIDRYTRPKIYGFIPPKKEEVKNA
ncbi:MAG: RnfABCDGE type electron transport complex subunit D [Candidatus Coatesbacteria bacterium]|nr:RnfABCDGE type electron transport complex subunit D [Candidatus Coatesbacteria bacterium]